MREKMSCELFSKNVLMVNCLLCCHTMYPNPEGLAGLAIVIKPHLMRQVTAAYAFKGN